MENAILIMKRVYMSVYNCHIWYTCIQNFRWVHLVSLRPLNCDRSDNEDSVDTGNWWAF